MKRTIHLLDVTDFRLADGTNSTDWFRAAFEALDLSGIDLRPYDSTQLAYPALDEACSRGHGIIVTGSAGPVFEAKPWIRPLIDFLRSAHERSAWILGVCFGHHALAAALGGEVTWNPRGREMGTVRIHLTPDGERSALFAGFKSGDPVNLVHRTHVSRLPAGAVRLAFNQMTPTQAFSLKHSFGVQPHPEFTPRQLEGLAALYEKILTGRERFLDDREHFDNWRRTFGDTPSFRLILSNFIQMIDA